MGISFTIGELTMLGYLKGFGPKVVSGWSSGTGFAGLFGTGLNFFLRMIELDTKMVIDFPLIFLDIFDNDSYKSYLFLVFLVDDEATRA